MKLHKALREHLRRHFKGTIRRESGCTCGSPNHVRVLVFRVDGQPCSVVIPEGCEISPAQLSRVLPGAQVGLLTEAELDAIYTDSELGRTQPFDNPFGGTVYLDSNLLQFETLVFCPRMFCGRKGECFRIATPDFLAAAHALILPLFPSFTPVSNP